MKKIESKESLLIWAKEVNQSTTKTLCNLQDDFMLSDNSALLDYFTKSSHNEKELIIFSISKGMGSSTLLEFISSYSRRKAEKYIESESTEIDKKWSEVMQAQHDIEIKGESYRLKTATLENQNEALNKSNTDLTTKTSNYVKRIWDLESNIEELEKTVEELQAFESHIKGLLKK